MGIERS